MQAGDNAECGQAQTRYQHIVMGGDVAHLQRGIALHPKLLRQFSLHCRVHLGQRHSGRCTKCLSCTLILRLQLLAVATPDGGGAGRGNTAMSESEK